MAIQEKALNDFLKDMSCSSKYTFLEEGKDNKELKEVCEKRGVAFPNQDLAIMKIVYAFIDKTNLNGASLPRVEVEKALHTIVGKAIDFDHIRERIVGFLLDAKIEGDQIISYGAFFKSSLGEDFEIIKELFARNNLAVSMEAWGQREFNDDGTYSLKDICFAGLGILINTKPAFPGAGVVEMANKRVLEFASTIPTIDKKESFVMTCTKEDMIKAEELKTKKLEMSRLYTWDMETIMTLSSQVVCPMCKAEGTIEINDINFKKNSMEATCWLCNADMKIELTPKSTMVLKDTASRQIKEVTKVEKTEDTKMSKTDNASVQEADALIKTEGDASSENTETIETVADATLDSDGKTVEQIIAEVKGEVKAEVAPVVAEVVPVVNADADALKAEIATLKEEIAKLKDKARAEGKVIGERRSTLGEIAKDMTDEDLLDDVKYENATLRKKLAEIEASKTVTVSETAAVKETKSLEVGTKDEEKDTPTDKLAKNVRKLAWNV
jgi:hypothetical protein